ncbi:hypothetical protein D9M72_472110 [compost metagenome]
MPYARPGLPLAKAIAERLQEKTSVLILGNHGLAIAAETVADAAILLTDVSRRLTAQRRPAPAAADLAALSRLAVDSGYCLPDDARLHAVATDLESCRIAAGGSLYPDHVIFLGKGVVVAAPGETALAIEAKRRAAGESLPPLLLFPGKGVLVQKEMSAGAFAMARCLADVTARIPADARLRYLTEAENAELLGWDAEKYRQQLNRAGQVLQ